MLKRKSFFDKMYQICCEKSLQISYWGWETVNYLGFAEKVFRGGRGCGELELRDCKIFARVPEER